MVDTHLTHGVCNVQISSKTPLKHVLYHEGMEQLKPAHCIGKDMLFILQREGLPFCIAIGIVSKAQVHKLVYVDGHTEGL